MTVYSYGYMQKHERGTVKVGGLFFVGGVAYEKNIH